MEARSRLDQSDLLNERVHADELQELLIRLAATEALFAEPVPTIRDVAEATDASPLLIGRILSQMRGPDEVAALKGRMDGFEARLKELEAVRQERSMIPTLLKNSGASSFRPLGKRWDGIKKPDYKDETYDESWSKVKEWYGTAPIGAESSAGSTNSSESKMWVVWLIGALYLMFVAGGGCNTNPNSQYDRPFPFPVERSTR